MGRNFRTAILSVFVSTLILASISLFSSLQALSRLPIISISTTLHQHPAAHLNDDDDAIIDTDSVLQPDWEVLLVTNSIVTHHHRRCACVFQNNATVEAKRLGVLQFGGRGSRTVFKCVMPTSVRRIRPFYMPNLVKWPVKDSVGSSFYKFGKAELMRWTFLVYDSFSTDEDVVVFAKGVNRHTHWRTPESLTCVFTDIEDDNVVARTSVSSSSQEVFHCAHPDLTTDVDKVKISIEMMQSDEGQRRLAPSVAYYSLPQVVASRNTYTEPKRDLCASTMVRNVAKFLKEWVMHHSAIGVEKFILYDNDSDDDLAAVVEELNRNGHNVTTLFWPWAKTQEAGFSHSAIFANQTCRWMMFLDVNEFVFSPKWLKAPHPSPSLLKSLLPGSASPLRKSRRLLETEESNTGQVIIRCHDFGPSNQTSHPVTGVTQGYTCRLNKDERHKSITKLSAIDHSVRNEIHHFQLKPGKSNKRFEPNEAVVNHYKYQAWPEFKAKFKRRVSAYVVDWTEPVNLNSKDRTPELGFEAIEPEDWPQKFCEREDKRLQVLTRTWFGSGTSSRTRMAWQR